MEIQKNDKLIRNTRISRGMTQAELAKNICSVKELQRIEKGEVSPNLYTYERLLIRLGADLSSFLYIFANKEDQVIYKTIMDIRELIYEREYVLAEEKYDLLQELPYYKRDDPFIKQFSLYFEAAFLYSKQMAQESLDIAYKAINVTLPNYSKKYIDKYLLIEIEYLILNLIAILHAKLHDTNKTIDILTRVVDSINRENVYKYIKPTLVSTIYYSLSKYLGQNNQHAEALLICEQGIETCKKTKTMKNYGELMYNKACSLFYLGDNTNAQKFFQHSCNVIMYTGNMGMVELIKKNAIEKYGILLTDS